MQRWDALPAMADEGGRAKLTCYLVDYAKCGLVPPRRRSSRWIARALPPRAQWAAPGSTGDRLHARPARAPAPQVEPRPLPWAAGPVPRAVWVWAHDREGALDAPPPGREGAFAAPACRCARAPGSGTPRAPRQTTAALLTAPPSARARRPCPARARAPHPHGARRGCCAWPQTWTCRAGASSPNTITGAYGA